MNEDTTYNPLRERLKVLSFKSSLSTIVFTLGIHKKMCIIVPIYRLQHIPIKNII